MLRNIIFFFLAILVCTSCYRSESQSFYDTHHYDVGYNFFVRNDSINLIAQQPEEHVSQLVTDSFAVPHDMRVAVSEIRSVPQDSIDSIWVQLLTEDGKIGWTHETQMLDDVVPTDPISQFIIFFSDAHMLFAIIFVVLIGALYFARITKRRNAPMVHFKDIPSIYPTLFCITVACAATFYASIQMFDVEGWRHFYFHPSLNPFILSPMLGVFVASVWIMLIIGIATVDEIVHLLNSEDALLYIASLVAFCGVLYIIFSISTLYYIGYPLLVAYCWFAYQKLNKTENHA